MLTRGLSKKPSIIYKFAVSNNSKQSNELAVSSCLPQLEGGGSRSETEGVPRHRSGIQSIYNSEGIYLIIIPCTFNLYKDFCTLEASCKLRTLQFLLSPAKFAQRTLKKLRFFSGGRHPRIIVQIATIAIPAVACGRELPQSASLTAPSN